MNRASRWALLTSGAVLAVLGGLVVAGRWSQGQLDPSVRPPSPSRPPTTTMVAPTGVTQVSLTGPRDDVAVSVAALGERPGSVAVSKELVWVSDPEGATVVRVDPDVLG